MRVRFLAVGMLMMSCLVAGCEGGGGEATTTPENPQAGLDAVKKLQTGPVPTAKGLVPRTEAEKK